MSKFLWILDNGHGGIINGVPQTEGKRSPVWEDETFFKGNVTGTTRQLFEGEFNRAIVNRLAEKLQEHGIRYVKLVPQDQDISVYERIIRAKTWCEQENCILISIHANETDGVSTKGIEIFKPRGEAQSDKLAEVFTEHWSEITPSIRIRVDGDYEKEENFKLIRKVPCPAILIENWYMDNPYECKNWLLSDVGRNEIVLVYLQAIFEIEQRGLNNL